jgi:dienelactone hydrolase
MFGGTARVYEGTLMTPNLLAGFSGPFTSAPTPEPIRFLLVVPEGPVPPDGWPVTIFSHGLRGSRYHALRMAPGLLGIGHATLAIDLTHHGDRSDCVGAGPLAGPGASDNAVCNTFAAATCNTTTRRCTGAVSGANYMPNSAEDPTAMISGWNIIEPTNLFGTRDRFRQTVIDFSQLARMVKAGSFNDGAVALSTSDITYVGQSLGGILGTLYTAASPDVGNVALNVPGGGLVDVLLTSPSFADQAAGFKALLAANGMPEGTPGYDNFINIARWIMDPADPLNAAHQVLNGPVTPEGRQALIQYIPEDQTIPNSTTEALIAAAMRGDRELTVSLFEAFGNMPPEERHGFLFRPETAEAAQAQITTFISTGSLP